MIYKIKNKQNSQTIYFKNLNLFVRKKNLRKSYRYHNFYFISILL